MIIKGKMVLEGPEWQSYERIYEKAMPKIKSYMHQIEELFRNRKIPYGQLDGKKLAYLSLKKNVTLRELIECLLNV